MNQNVSTADSSLVTPQGWRWAPAWVLAFVALWPTTGVAEGVMVLGALLAIIKLIASRFRHGTSLLSGPAWALTSVLFAAYWLPQLISAPDALNPSDAFSKAAKGLRYLPFLWLVAMAVADARGRRLTFGGLSLIVLLWAADALLQAVVGTSPLFWSLDQLKWLISDRSLCPTNEMLAPDRFNGIFSACNPKLGQVLASLSPFAMYWAGRRFGISGWLIAAVMIGLAVILAGARAAWITYALVLLFSGWRLLGAKKLLAVFAVGALAISALAFVSEPVRERIVRTTQAFEGDQAGVDTALSGRTRIWGAATCMVREHPINGVGIRDFREAFPECDPQPGARAAWGEGPALHAHQIILEILSETGAIGLLLWLAGAALAWRAWRYANEAARERARPAMLALAVTVFPFNTHLAFYSTFWGGVTLLLAALYAGSLLARDDG